MPELLFNEQQQTMPFAIKIQVRDGMGQPTGKTRTFQSDDGSSLCDWYERNSHTKKPKNKKRNNDK